MSYLEKFLKEKNARLSYERRWLVYDAALEQWEIYAQPYGEKVSFVRAFRPERLESALECLETGQP